VCINYNTDKAVIIHFPAFAGGKFISNCLSLSKYACPQDPEAATYLCNYPDDYVYRLKKVMQTIPTKNKMLQWRSGIEFGDIQLYGKGCKHWEYGYQTQDINDTVQKLINSQLNFFITAHGDANTVSTLLTVWPNAKVIVLYNFTDFVNIAVKLKTKSGNNDSGNANINKYNTVLSGPDWPSWHELNQALFNVNNLDKKYDIVKNEINNFYPWRDVTNPIVGFDVSTFFAWELFKDEMQQLYTWFEFDDFNEKRLKSFWEAYIALHI